MSEPFLGEIKIVAFNFPPRGWAFCNGQFLQINQNQALFALLGTTYGGNGQTTFALPDLRGRVAMHTGGGHILGERAGAEAVTLTLNELPQHIHIASATGTQATLDSPTNNVLGKINISGYVPATSGVAMNPGVIAPVGGSQPHPNMQPYLVNSFIIALQGIFPSRN